LAGSAFQGGWLHDCRLMREGLRNEDYVAVIATAGPADRV